MTKFHVPAAVGVPPSAPPVVSVRPGGNVPVASDQVYGAMPPAALNVCEYGAPNMAGGSGVPLVIVTGMNGVFTVSENGLEACDWAPALLSEAWITKFHVPVAVGVPLSTPAVVSVRPGGSGPPVVATVHQYGAVPPFALNVCEYDAPTVPEGS